VQRYKTAAVVYFAAYYGNSCTIDSVRIIQLVVEKRETSREVDLIRGPTFVQRYKRNLELLTSGLRRTNVRSVARGIYPRSRLGSVPSGRTCVCVCVTDDSHAIRFYKNERANDTRKRYKTVVGKIVVHSTNSRNRIRNRPVEPRERIKTVLRRRLYFAQKTIVGVTYTQWRTWT